MKPHFEPVTQNDIDELLRLSESFYQKLNMPFVKERSRRLLLELVETPTIGKTWFIRMENERIGYIIVLHSFSLEFGGHTTYIEELFIEEAYRHQGIGTHAIHFMEDYAREKGSPIVFLEVAHDNDNAQKFYKTCGYRDTRHFYLYKNVLPEKERPEVSQACNKPDIASLALSPLSS